MSDSIHRSIQSEGEVFTGSEPQLLNYPHETLSDYAQKMGAFADYVAGVDIGPTIVESERRSLAIVQAG